MLKLNKHGVNSDITATILPDEGMRKIGFTDFIKDRWYFFRELKVSKKFKRCNWEISFNVTIPKDGSDISIDVLDEDFGQPYDYQAMLERNPSADLPLFVKEEVEKYMSYLQINGVLHGHKYGEYI